MFKLFKLHLLAIDIRLSKKFAVTYKNFNFLKFTFKVFCVSFLKLVYISSASVSLSVGLRDSVYVKRRRMIKKGKRAKKIQEE